MVDLLIGKIRTQNPYKEKTESNKMKFNGEKIYSILHVESRKLHGQI